MGLAHNDTAYSINCKLCTSGVLDIRHENNRAEGKKYARGSCGCKINAPHNQHIFDQDTPVEPPATPPVEKPVKPAVKSQIADGVPATKPGGSPVEPPATPPVEPPAEPAEEGSSSWLA